MSNTTTPPPLPPHHQRQQLQDMLQAAVQSVQWTYCIFWQFCPHRGILVWCDGYYNGSIKTRKTVQAAEVTAEEASLQRSQQLKELYESLSAGEANQSAKRPCAALSPEDLTETEWFYLMCVSFSFPPGVGLPGKAYAKRKHVWLTGANDVDSNIYCRTILAQSARVQTVVCIPLLDGVLELGSTSKVKEDHGLIERWKSFFTDHNYQHPPAPKPALSGHSTSDPSASSAFHSPPLFPPVFTPIHLHYQDDPEDDLEIDNNINDTENNDHDDAGSENPDPETEHHDAMPVAAESVSQPPTELMQLDMSEDIRLGSPDECSNQLGSSTFNLIGSDDPIPPDRPQRWRFTMEEEEEGDDCFELDREDTHYSHTVSAVLQNNRLGSSTPGPTSSAHHTAFATWTRHGDDDFVLPNRTTSSSQWALKHILFNVPYLHNKYREENANNSPKSSCGGGSRLRKGNSSQDEVSANHVMAEQKFIQFQLTVNVAALVINVVAAITSGDVPLNAVQLLWVNLIMDTLGALALATEPPTDHLMERTPVGRREPLITNIMWRNLLIQAMYQVGVLLVLNFSGISILGLEHDSKPRATIVKNTMIFNTFVMCQIFNEFNARKPDEINVFSGVTKNKLFMGIIGFTFILQIILIEFSGKFTKTVKLSWKLWLVSLAIGLVSWPLAAIGKLIPVPETPASEYFVKPLMRLRNRNSNSNSSQ